MICETEVVADHVCIVFGNCAKLQMSSVSVISMASSTSMPR